MMDAIIEEQRGRRIRIGDRWLADFASCNYLGFDLDEEIIASVPDVPRRSGNALLRGRACLGNPTDVRARSKSRMTELSNARMSLVPADDHPHPHVR